MGHFMRGKEILTINVLDSTIMGGGKKKDESDDG